MKHLSNRTYLLIAVLTGFTVFFLVLALRQPSPIPAPITPTPTPVEQSVLKLVEVAPSNTTTASATKAFAVEIDTNTNAVTVVQMEIGYDPKVTAIKNITSGTFFSNPVQLLKNIDAKNGRISYALGIQPQDTPKKGKGTVAIVEYSLLPNPPTNVALFYLMPKSIVGAAGISSSVLKDATSLRITLSNVTPATASVTPVYRFGQTTTPTPVEE